MDLANLKNLRGTLSQNAPIGQQSWFRCGGAADLLFQPADQKDLQTFLAQWPENQPLCVIGGLANTIVRDGGVRGAVVKLGKEFSAITCEGEVMTIGAGALNGTAASMAAKNGIGGLEFLSGIPGTIGGACAMNAGAYGNEICDILQELRGVDRQGQEVTLAPEDLQMTYRRGNIPQGVIITQAIFKGREEDTQSVRARLKEIKDKRNTTQPIRENTGGSTFANPSDDMRAWQVVEKVGGRGLQIGGAAMSEMHCNFMVNAGGASAQDLETLGDELIKRAQDQLNVKLRWEIKRIGDCKKSQ